MILLAAGLLLAQPAPASHAGAERLVDRAERCLHWGGEEGYDAARRRQIDEGFKTAGCDTINRDAKAFLKRHPARADGQAVRKAVAGLGE